MNATIPKFSEYLSRCDDSVKPRRAAELRVVWGLLHHLSAEGITPYNIQCDGEDLTEKDGEVAPADALDHVFSVDECWVNFRKGGKHCGAVLIVLGNSGWDAVSNYSWPHGDAAGFEALMDKFDGEKYL